MELATLQSPTQIAYEPVSALHTAIYLGFEEPIGAVAVTLGTESARAAFLSNSSALVPSVGGWQCRCSSRPLRIDR